MTAHGGFKLADAPDLDQSGIAPGKAVVVAGDGVTFEIGTVVGGGGSAETTTFDPSGNLAATDVQAALEELDAEKQPLDSDLTAIAALTTTAFGRALLALANQAALLAAAGAAAASHAHAGEDITSGTVAEARIASTIARDTEVSAAIAALSTVYQPLDSDLTSIASLTTTAFGRSVLEAANQAALLALAGAAAASHAHAGEDITSGTVADARIASTIARDSEVTAAIAAALAAADGAGLSDNGSGVLSVVVDDVTLEISSDSVRVKAGGIGASHIATGAVGSDELADDAVDTAAIQNGAVTAAKVAADVATQAELDAHVNDATAAHAASAVSADSTTLAGTGTDVQAVLEELDNAIADHLADTTAHTAANIPFTPNGSIAATNVQDAIQEVRDEAGAGGSVTKRVPILGFAARPDDTAEAFFEPLNLNFGSNDVARQFALCLGSALAAAPTVKHGVYGSFVVPSDYSSAASLVLEWSATLTSGDVVFDFDYSAVGGNDAESLDPAAWQESVTATDTAPGTARRKLTVTIDLTDGNFAAGDVVEFFLGRDGAAGGDTMAGRAYLVAATFEYDT